MSMTDHDSESAKRAKTEADNKDDSGSSQQDIASLLKSWVSYDPATCDFPIQNLPYGVFTRQGQDAPHIAVAIGDYALDLYVLAEKGIFDKVDKRVVSALKQSTLNEFMGLGKSLWSHTRMVLQALLQEDSGDARLKDDAAFRQAALIPRSSITMLLPAKIGDYTDFYASRNHAYNVGVMFRGKDNALQPNWTWLPVGYHGRASSVVVSGTDLKRPCGQKVGVDGNPPAAHGESKALDYELGTLSN